ncbi:unnamed protein product [Camellia sinensis]
MSLLDANPTRIVPFREVCDVNAFKIATSLIITGVLAAEAKCKIAFKIACPSLLARAKDYSLELGLARAKECALEPRIASIQKPERVYSSLEPRIRRSSQGTSRNHEKYTTRSSQKSFARASLRIRISQGTPISTRKKSLEEVLEGDCFTNTLHHINFKVEKERATQCEKDLTIEEVVKFRYAIHNKFEFQMYCNNIDMRGAVGKVESASGNFSSPRSNLDSTIDITEDAAVRIKFTYSVFWNRFKHQSADSIFWNETLRNYVWATEKQGQKFSILSFLAFTSAIVI